MADVVGGQREKEQVAGRVLADPSNDLDSSTGRGGCAGHVRAQTDGGNPFDRWLRNWTTDDNDHNPKGTGSLVRAPAGTALTA